jgi:alanine racemase
MTRHFERAASPLVWHGATMVDITDIPEAGMWSEAVLMGRQGTEEITACDVAKWKGTVTYELLVGWRSRLPRVYLDE